MYSSQAMKKNKLGATIVNGWRRRALWILFLIPGLLMLVSSHSPPVEALLITTDDATFVNDTIFVEIDEFQPISITPEMIEAGESAVAQSTLRVHSTFPYTLRVYIADEDDVDLAGSIVNENHPMLFGGVRDVFEISVSDGNQQSSGPPVPGSIPEELINQTPSIGTSGNEHLIQVRLVFSRNGEPYFLQAKPGQYTVTLTYEVEPEW